jgi:hypothetical protein
VIADIADRTVLVARPAHRADRGAGAQDSTAGSSFAVSTARSRSTSRTSGRCMATTGACRNSATSLEGEGGLPSIWTSSGATPSPSSAAS